MVCKRDYVFVGGVCTWMSTTMMAATLVVAGASVPALAGGWPQPKGEGQVIVTGIYSQARDRFDLSGDLDGSQLRYDKIELSAFAEYGLTERWTLMAKPVVRASWVNAPYGVDNSGGGASELGVRYFFGEPWRGGVVSGQVAALIPGDGEDSNADPLGAAGPGGEVRVFLGQGYSWGFGEAQLAWRDRADAPDGATHG